MTLQWLADRLRRATWTHVPNLLDHVKNQRCVNTKDPMSLESSKFESAGKDSVKIHPRVNGFMVV